MRILMLGNSLTTSHDLPQLLAEQIAGQVEVHARGGARLSEHLNPQTRLGKLTQHAFEEGALDYVIMQEMSNGPVRFRKRFLETTAQLCRQVRECGAVPVLYATWAYAPGCAKLDNLGLSHEEMHRQMHDAYLETARTNDALLADVADAFFRHEHKLDLYASDGVHPSEAGTQLASAVLSSTLMKHALQPAS